MTTNQKTSPKNSIVKSIVPKHLDNKIKHDYLFPLDALYTANLAKIMKEVFKKEVRKKS